MRRVVTVVVVVGLVVAAGIWLGDRWERGPLPSVDAGCLVKADGEVTLETEQMANAATITAVGVRLGMPEQAAVVAIATAMQESKLRNLPHLGRGNDHDSVGLFQQRPSQGWGSKEQVSDPRYASERFYLALRDVAGWQEMRVTEAAQRVQRSAYPEAYEKWAEDAEVLATALLGRAGGAVSCHVPEDPQVRGEAATTALGTALASDWGEGTALAPASAGVSLSAADQATGWQYAHWLVSHAATHGVTRVHFAELEWTAGEGGWSRAASVIDHVLAEVAAGR